jgi:hypothetical protein
MGVSLAYPTNCAGGYAFPFNLNMLTAVLVTVDLKIDTFGCVADIQPGKPEDSTLVRSSCDFLRAYDFCPGRDDGRLSEQIIPVQVRLGPYGWRPDVTFPVDSDLVVLDSRLYEEALGRNGITLAKIESFPSIFCTLKPKDTLVVYPYVLVRVDLDSLGTPSAIEPVTSNCTSLSQSIQSAAAWARYVPSMQNGRAVASTNYLLVSFFPDVSYPTSVWPSHPPLAPNPYQNLMFRLSADTVGLLSPPLPRHGISEEVSLPVERLPYMDSVAVQIRVDTLGRMTVQRVFPANKWTSKLAKGLPRGIRFFPALAFDGSTMPYTGWAFVTTLNERSIRIRYSWLQ